MAHSGARHIVRSPASSSTKAPVNIGHLSKAGSLSGQQAIEAGAPIYRKGSGLAQLARHLQTVQRLRTAPAKLNAATDLNSEDALNIGSEAPQAPSPNAVAKWTAATGLVMSHEVARHVRHSAKLKALQRTPHHLIVIRIRELLRQLQQVQAGPAPAPQAVEEQEFAVPSWMATTKKAVDVSLAASVPPVGPSFAAEADDSGKLGSGTNMLDEGSIVDELSIILMFLNPFLAKLPDEARQGLCRRMRLEAINRDHTIYKQGEELQNFSLILTGIVEMSSRRMGNRSKTLLKKGQTLGERAILDGEPAGETCMAGSPVVTLLVNRHDFLSVLEPYMMEEKRGMVDFLHTAVACFRDLPRGHIINLAQHLQQVEYPEGAEFDSSDGNVYFVKAGQMQMRAMDKLLVGRQAEESLAQAAAAVPTMAATGPLSKVEIRDGQLVGTLGRQLPSKQTARGCSRLLSEMVTASFFGGGSLLNGEGDLQSALVCCAPGPVTLFVISLAEFSKHATPEVLRAMRDEVCFRLTYYQGRAGLIGVDAVVGHSQASLGPSQDKPVKKSKTKTSKRKLSTPKGAQPAAAQLAGASFAGDHVPEAEETTREQIVRYYTAVQQSNVEPLPTTPPNSRSSSSMCNQIERYYSNGTPAERYWSSQGAHGSSKRQNVSNILQTIFPDGLAPLAQKVASIERQEQVRAHRLAARQAAELSLAASDPQSAGAASVDTAGPGSASFEDALTRLGLGTDATVASDAAPAGMASASANAEPAQQAQARSLSNRAAGRSHVSFSQAAAGRADTSAVQSSDSQQGVGSWSHGLHEDQVRSSPAASSSVGNSAAACAAAGAAASAINAVRRPLPHKHYNHGQKLAAAILWETASGKSQPVRLRQCLTYSEIRMKNLTCKDDARLPLSGAEYQESARYVAQEA